MTTTRGIKWTGKFQTLNTFRQLGCAPPRGAILIAMAPWRGPAASTRRC